MGKRIEVDTQARRFRRRGKPGEVGLAAVGVRAAPDGSLMIFRWAQTGKPWWRRLIPQRVKDLHAAIRMQDHILEETYGLSDKSITGEVQRLESFLAAVSDLENRLWQWKYLDHPAREQIKIDFAHLAKRFANFKNEWKLLAGGQFYAAKTLIDRLGRRNPPAMAFRARGALFDLRQRLEQIGMIAAKLAARKQALMYERRRIERIIKDAAAGVDNMLSTPAFKGGKITATQRRGADQRISHLLRELGTIRVNPYKGPRTGAASKLLRAQRAIRRRRFSEAKTCLEAALQTLKEMKEL